MCAASSDSPAAAGEGGAVRMAMFGGALGVTGVFFIDVCGAVFACGCRSLWRGAAAACNVHEAAGPHCPWCANSVAGAAAFFAVLGAQAALIWLPSRTTAASRMVLAVAALPLVGGAVGWVQGVLLGYWA